MNRVATTFAQRGRRAFGMCAIVLTGVAKTSRGDGNPTTTTGARGDCCRDVAAVGGDWARDTAGVGLDRRQMEQGFFDRLRCSKHKWWKESVAHLRILSNSVVDGVTRWFCSMWLRMPATCFPHTGQPGCAGAARAGDALAGRPRTWAGGRGARAVSGGRATVVLRREGGRGGGFGFAFAASTQMGQIMLFDV